MHALTVAQLRILDAVVARGSLQAAAEHLGRTHPTLHVALNKIERDVGFTLFERSGYRLVLTPEGAGFLARARRVIAEMNALEGYVDRIAAGDETELRVMIGDLSPLSEMLGLLRQFFSSHPQTRLNLEFEALAAPWKSLAEDRCDLILHHVEHGDARFEKIDLGSIRLIPVAAPGLLPFDPQEATLERMRDFVQCVIRDRTNESSSRNYFLIDGARTCTVTDQMMKREVILQGLGWGHMPHFLIADDLKAGTLVSFANRHFPGGAVMLAAARKAAKAHGPIATKLWNLLLSRERARS